MKLCPTPRLSAAAVSSPSRALSLPLPRNWPSLSPFLSRNVQSKGAVRSLPSLSHPPSRGPGPSVRPSVAQDDNSVRAKLRLIGLVSRSFVTFLPDFHSPFFFPHFLPSFSFLWLASSLPPSLKLPDATAAAAAVAFAPDCAHRARKFPLFLIARVINGARGDGQSGRTDANEGVRVAACGCASGGFERFVIHMRQKDRQTPSARRDFNAHLCLTNSAGLSEVLCSLRREGAISVFEAIPLNVSPPYIIAPIDTCLVGNLGMRKKGNVLT